MRLKSLNTSDLGNLREPFWYVLYALMNPDYVKKLTRHNKTAGCLWSGSTFTLVVKSDSTFTLVVITCKLYAKNTQLPNPYPHSKKERERKKRKKSRRCDIDQDILLFNQWKILKITRIAVLLVTIVILLVPYRFHRKEGGGDAIAFLCVRQFVRLLSVSFQLSTLFFINAF